MVLYTSITQFQFQIYFKHKLRFKLHKQIYASTLKDIFEVSFLFGATNSQNPSYGIVMNVELEVYTFKACISNVMPRSQQGSTPDQKVSK